MAKKSNVSEQQLKEEQELQSQRVEEGVGKVNEFLETNRKPLIICVSAIVIIVLAVILYLKFYHQPRCAEAQEQMFPAEASFRAEKWDLALNGDGNTLGFAQVIDEYGSRAGKSAYLYAGLCELKLGNYENAVSYLKKYSTSDDLMAARALGAEGDAYVGMGSANYAQALSCYDKAAAKADNFFTSSYLIKAGVLCEEMGDKDKALAYYKKIKDAYPQSMEAYEIDKYISRIENAQ